MGFGDVRTPTLVPVGVVFGRQAQRQAVGIETRLDQVDAVAVARAVEQPSPDGDARRIGVDRAEQDGGVVVSRLVGVERPGVLPAEGHLGSVDGLGIRSPRRRRTPRQGDGRRDGEEGSASHG